MELGEIYDLWGDGLFRYLTVKLGSVQDAEDVLQETFVRLARAAGRRRLLRDPKSYAFRCAHNEACRFLKRTLGRRDREAVFRPELASAVLQGADEASEIRLGKALASLPGAQREAVLLKEYEGLTFREIGEACGVTTFTAASRYRYGMARLRDFFGEAR